MNKRQSPFGTVLLMREGFPKSSYRRGAASNGQVLLYLRDMVVSDFEEGIDKDIRY